MSSKKNHRVCTVALSKGKLLPPSISFLKKLKVNLPPDFATDRRLIFDIPAEEVTKASAVAASQRDDSLRQGALPPMKIILARATDVPTYVEHGAADIGIVGSDLLAEQMRNVYEMVDLDFGHCRLVLAEPKEKKGTKRLKPRIATKYPNMTERYFLDKGIPIEIIKLYGSIEIAPLVGLADQIVDLSETGETLKAQGLEIVDTIAECSARMIVNRAAFKLEYPMVFNLIEAIKKAI
ncbi:MAG: ATP phosphoribosyltransferase [Nitrospirota bacterium]